ncbi:exonuclease [Candidatus Woesearchaeota archaeon]|nr:exonuclease [Candidatus Woesearchaeota archaeon]
MLKSTFVHIPGVSKYTEEYLWKNSITTWHEFLDKHKTLSLHQNKIDKIKHYTERSIQAHGEDNIGFFLKHMHPKIHWRTYKEYKPCFLDIETTGLSKHRDDITIAGLYDGKQSKIFINGKNLEELKYELDKYNLLVTFNGKCFDIPFIQSKYPELDLNKFHIDLRFAMRPLGYSGGLKNIEKQAGIQRDDDLQDIDGWEAVRLWYKYQKGDERSLDLLVKYNIADIENLKLLMDMAFKKLKQREFLG